ncbi:MAG: hypothetical protein H6767_01940 [Candidatus Peribacteria bacterium]|nr:MAG: hypothetical protein H6767_01940 [Candidatus Peribacteria bacterium]
MSYGDLGIILSHSYAPSIAVSGKDFSLRVWKSLGVFQNDTGLEDTVTRSEFYNIVDWISAQTDIQDMIYETIDKNTLLTIDTLTADLQVLSAELALLRQIEDEEQHESMKSCILGTSCSIPQKYIQEMKQTPKTTARSNNAETITRATYSNYMSTLYASFGDEMRKSKGYTDESYSTFIQILVESV